MKNKEDETSALSAEFAAGQTKKLKEPRVIEEWVLWLEERPNEGGRTTALIRPFGHPELPPQELTPPPRDLRSRIHGYGGGVIAHACEGDNLILTWVDNQDGCVWKESWGGLIKNLHGSKNWLYKNSAPLKLSQTNDMKLADGVIDPSRNIWIGIMEKNNKDFLITLSINEENQSPRIIHQAQDFAGYLALSTKADQLLWVEWQQPNMPWDSSELWWGKLSDSAQLTDKKLIAGSKRNDKQKISVFQPLWTKENHIFVNEDKSGWWNLIGTKSNPSNSKSMQWNEAFPIQAETAMPQWVYGMKTTAISNENILISLCSEGKWSIQKTNQNGESSIIEQPFNEINGLHAEGERAVAIASNSQTYSGLLEIDLEKRIWHHTPANKACIKSQQISCAEPIWFEGFNKKKTHAWYYPPIGGNKKETPLLVKSHSGPTSMASSGLDLNIQFWTSRGWGVVDVNYGGSTGFGREYRERLDKNWGVVDVFDCIAVVKKLIKERKANNELIAIEGSSAGGFTTLSCLCSSNIFKVGACRYAVSNLEVLAENTSHRFEEKYIENLIGKWPEERNTYKTRSPINQVDHIKSPVIFFQGMKDNVVKPEHTFTMAEALKNRGIPVEVYTFPEEAHGFKDGKARVKVLKETERFFSKHLGL